MTRFVLYRILGNDLPPRHRAGQTLDNLRFILGHEPPLPGCEKRWVVNRIVDRSVERAAIRLIRAAGHSYIHIPFDLAAYARRSFRWDHLPPERYLHRAGFRRLPWIERSEMVAACLADRNGYAMNNNGARNAALREGRLDADWVLPWDGGCFIAATAWQAIVDSAREASARYLVVPLTRIERNAALLDPQFAPRALEEPQIAFGPGSVESFDESVPYGGSPKASLLVRLGVPGTWNQWSPAIKAARRLGPSPDAGRYRTVGWTARLESGNAEAEANADARHRHRLQATISFIARLDAAIVRRA